MKFTKKSIYIVLFGILYLIVAFSSFFHACAFFGLANNSWMSIILAFAFEVGQAAVLFSLLTSTKDRSRIMPWVLMTMFTLVQVIGNVYSSYKYIITNSVENLRFFKEPIFIWTDLPDAQANVIIVYLVGALLPIAALLLTSMITNYLSDQSEEQKQLETKIINEPTEKEERNNEQEIKDLNTLVNDKDKEIENLKQELEKKEQEISTRDNVIESINKEIEDNNYSLEEKLEEIEKLKQENDILKNIPKDENGKIIGTDPDGGVIGEPGEEGKVSDDYKIDLNNEKKNKSDYYNEDKQPEDLNHNTEEENVKDADKYPDESDIQSTQPIIKGQDDIVENIHKDNPHIENTRPSHFINI